MKILRIADIPNNRTTGMARTMYGTGDAMAAAGHQVDYFFMEQIGGLQSPRLRRFTTPFRIPALLRRALRKGSSYDVVELHETLAAPLLFFGKLMGPMPPIVLFSYGLAIRAHLAELEYKKQQGLPISTRERYSPLADIFQAMYAIRRCDHVICSNSDDVQYLIRIGIPATCLTQHHSGVDNCFLQAGAELASAAPLRSGILFLGSWLLRKGIRELAAAATRVMRNHPGIPLTVAGCICPPEAVRGAFPADLHGRIEVIAHLATDADIIRACSRRSVFVLPSYAEGQPLAMMEAAALGLAIVTTNSPGMRDFIEDGKNGVLVCPGDALGLAQSLDRLIACPDETRKLGEAVRRKVQDFTWTNAAYKIEAAYRKAKERAQRRRDRARIALTEPGGVVKTI